MKYPKIYDNVYEFKKLSDAENVLFEELCSLDEQAKYNQFILTCDELGIAKYEDFLNIVANPYTETLDERKARVINRLAMNAPFTTGYLRQKLDGIIGQGQYELSINYDSYTIYVKTASANQFWYQELRVTLNLIKPANMIFINMPSVYSTIQLSELVAKYESIYNYKLGYWRLGQLPFRTILERSEIKMPTKNSIKSELINRVAAFTTDEISKALINDTLQITDLYKETIDNSLIIKYTIEPDQIEEIVNVKLLDIDGNVLAQSDVYIPVLSDVIIHHEFLVKEGY